MSHYRFPLTIAAAILAALSFGCTPIDSSVTYRNSYDSVQPFMEGLYAATKNIEVSAQHPARAAIIPHHLVSPEAMAAGIRSLIPGNYKRIVLLSPDHFAQCSTLLCTTNGIFKTAFGDVKTSEFGVRQLAESPLVTVEPRLFHREHGIFSVVPFIAHELPDVQVIPIVISQTLLWSKDKDELMRVLSSLLDEETALVVSSDFSHYLPLSLAEQKDKETILAFISGDLDGIARLNNPQQSDCPNCLWIIASLAQEKGFFNPSVLLHTNSAVLLNDTSVKETTSHFAIVFYANDSLSTTDPAFAGDVTVTRGVPRKHSADLQRFWSGSGQRIVNLEGPLAESCLASSNPYIFCNLLNNWRKIADLATMWVIPNNHMLDQGLANATSQFLIEASEIPIEEEAMFGNVRVLAFTNLLNPVAEQQRVSIPLKRERIFKLLKEKSDARLTVVYVHDGIEYEALPSPSSRALYRSLIDAGADAVVVAHSHVPGDMEIYKEKPIFRGLGNFLFDQYDRVATQTAKIVRLKKSGDHILFETFTGK